MYSSFDTYLYLYSKHPETGALSQVAANDDAIGLNSRINYTPQPGVEYVIGASAFGGSGGSCYQLYFGRRSTVLPARTTPSTMARRYHRPAGGG